MALGSYGGSEQHPSTHGVMEFEGRCVAILSGIIEHAFDSRSRYGHKPKEGRCRRSRCCSCRRTPRCSPFWRSGSSQGRCGFPAPRLPSPASFLRDSCSTLTPASEQARTPSPVPGTPVLRRPHTFELFVTIPNGLYSVRARYHAYVGFLLVVSPVSSSGVGPGGGVVEVEAARAVEGFFGGA